MSTFLSVAKTLPFNKLSNSELLDTLESVERSIQRKLNDLNFKNYIKARSLLSDILDEPFKYVNTDYYSNYRPQQHHTNYPDIHIVHHNIRSFDKHFNKFIALSDTLGVPDISALSEIGQKNIENREAQLKNLGYDIKFEKPNKLRGGVALICKKNIKLEPRNDLKIMRPPNPHDLDIENIWYETNLKNIGPTVIGVIYKHPNSSVEGLKYFREQVEEKMKKINKQRKNAIILGDINTDGLKLYNDYNKLFFDMVLDNNFIPLVTLPTRIQDGTCSTIDHIFINQHLIRNTSKRLAGNIFSDISDHLPNFLIVNNKKNHVPNKKSDRPKVRIFGEKNTAQFKEHLKNANWKEIDDTDDPNVALDIFYKFYNTAFEKSFPVKTLSMKCSKEKKWMNASLRQQINNKNKLYRKFLLNPIEKNKMEYKTARNRVNKEIRNEEENYYRELMSNEKNNLKNLWDIAGKIINPNKIKRDTQIKALQVNGKFLSKNYDIANSLNDFFSSIGGKLAKKIKTTKSFKQYMGTSNPNTMTMPPVLKDEVIKLILTLKINKSAGDDGI